MFKNECSQGCSESAPILVRLFMNTTALPSTDHGPANSARMRTAPLSSMPQPIRPEMLEWSHPQKTQPHQPLLAHSLPRIPCHTGSVAWQAYQIVCAQHDKHNPLCQVRRAASRTVQCSTTGIFEHCAGGTGTQQSQSF